MFIYKDKIMLLILLVSHVKWLINAVFKLRISQILFVLGQDEC